MKAPDGSSYKLFSTIEDVIEKQSPVMWFGACAFLKHNKKLYSAWKRKEESIETLENWHIE